MFSTSDKTRGKEKMLVERAYGIDDLVSPALSIYIYIYIGRIELQRTRHPIDADRRRRLFSSCSLSLLVSFQSVTHKRYFLFCLYALCRASLHLMPPLPSTMFVTTENEFSPSLYSCHLVSICVRARHIEDRIERERISSSHNANDDTPKGEGEEERDV